MISREEYVKLKEKPETWLEKQNVKEWSNPKYQCPKCGGDVCKNLLVGRMLTSYPPIQQSMYRCMDCGFEEYLSD